MTNAAGFPILSLLTWLPLAGGLFIMTVRGTDEVIASNARWAALCLGAVSHLSCTAVCCAAGFTS